MHKRLLSIVKPVVAASTLCAANATSSSAQQLPIAADTVATIRSVATSTADSAAKREREAQMLDAVRISSRRRDSRYVPAYVRSATRTPALMRDVPQSMTVVSKELIRDQGMQSIADVIRYIPGVTMGQGEGHRDAPTIRGNATTADFFVDGVRDDMQYLRDVYNLERVEALKGSNAMIFGRGGAGGAINRVSKEALWERRREVTVETGEFGRRRLSGDVEHAVSRGVAARANGMYENSKLYRNGVTLERSGINPAFTIASRSRATRLAVAYEHFQDRRTTDRGIPSFQGSPIRTDRSTFFGNSKESYAKAVVNTARATLSHDAGAFTFRNHTLLADYDKFYQNVFPGAVNSAGTGVSLSAYHHDTQRSNLFNQAELTWTGSTGRVGHVFLAGAELGRQRTENFRETGYLNGASTSVLVPVSAPATNASVTYRQSSSDADNGTVAETRSIYVQDQLALSRKLLLIVGVRHENFDLRFRDDRSPARITQVNDMISPRLGLVVKPHELISFYGSHSLSFLPGSGDQFSTLTDLTAALRPERFANFEIGAKWDAMDRLSLAAAVYRLDRTNTRALHPTDPALSVQTGRQRSQGFEMTASGNVTSAWEIAGGFARQSAKIISASTVGPAGARVPLVPLTSVSLWNKYALSARLAIGIGVVRQSQMFASIDNQVVIPSFTRFDAGLYGHLIRGLSARLNVENLTDTWYYSTAHSNNNITPGSPRA
ncbi:MAG: TonB-dependent siderophore receptor, partial [Gemmatimonadaceae bacterium]|nr:TonB-dependent siderophore receptor [Gemmatimonadaceae bacterium]